jgi:hypothetical protein
MFGLGFVHFMAGWIGPQFGELHDKASFGIISVAEIHPAQLVLYIHLLLVNESYRLGVT